MDADVISDVSRITKRKGITRLHQRLVEQGISVYPTGRADIAGMARGGAYFRYFLPEQTSFRLLSGFPKYFQVAKLYNLLSPQDATLLNRKLLSLGTSVRETYKGRFQKNLHTGLIGEFLDSASDEGSLRLLEDAESSFADVLHEELLLPCVVDDYLMAGEFRNLRLDQDAISRSVLNPMQVLIASMGAVNSGPWLGLSAEDISSALAWFEAAGSRQSTNSGAPANSRPYAEKLVVPVFSSGVQGTLFGFFCDLRQEQKAAVRNILDQAARQLGEECALERKTKLRAELDRKDLHAETLAKAVIQFASPVEHVVISSPEGHLALTICKEENYLAGYEQKAGDEAAALTQDPCNELLESPILDLPAKIYIKPLQGYAALDPIMHGLRVRTAFLDFWSGYHRREINSSPTRSNGALASLNIGDVDRAILALEHQMAKPHGKLGAAKSLCFFETVKSSYSAEEVRLSNHEIQRRMSEKLGSEKFNGYQVAGKALGRFEVEVNRILPGKFVFAHLNDRVIRVSWKAARV